MEVAVVLALVVKEATVVNKATVLLKEVSLVATVGNNPATVHNKVLAVNKDLLVNKALALLKVMALPKEAMEGEYIFAFSLLFASRRGLLCRSLSFGSCFLFFFSSASTQCSDHVLSLVLVLASLAFFWGILFAFGLAILFFFLD